MPVLRDSPDLWKRFERLSRFGVVYLETSSGGWVARFANPRTGVPAATFEEPDLLTAVALLVRHVEAFYAPPHTVEMGPAPDGPPGPWPPPVEWERPRPR